MRKLFAPALIALMLCLPSAMQAKGYSMVYIPLTIEEITEGSYSTPETAGGETGIDCIESTDN